MAEPTSARACPIEMSIRVNGYDVDFQGVVNNIVYVRWFDDLRYRLLDAYLPLEQQMAAGFGPVVTSTFVEYKRPIRMHDKPVGHLWVTEAGRLRWAVGIEILVGDAVAATGVQTGVFINLKTLRPVRVPEVFTAAMERAMGGRAGRSQEDAIALPRPAPPCDDPGHLLP